ncbi:adiponectin receptor protein-like [Macrosteles quadrilineatus]|uniref:adiponectin receptor protein-like n=1 Tax=Macrosteles quadrilineatus TaxID=74068 RepID=UPI0023E31424|nr:adiponectin receptor protein-like [Macrosteles quadrilineatus]
MEEEHFELDKTKSINSSSSYQEEKSTQKSDTLRKRMVNTVDVDTDAKQSEDKASDSLRTKHYTWKTCDYWSLPKWRQDNYFILKGYRPSLPSFWACFLSIFRIHTESGNIWTHVFGCVLFLSLFLHVSLSSLPLEDKLVLSPFFIGAILCLGFSSSYHTLMCHSQSVSSMFNHLDYCGITLLIIGSFVPWVYYAFLCDSRLRLLYIAAALALGTVTVVLSLSPRFITPVYRTIRATVFVALGLSGVIPGLHFIVLNGVETLISFAAPLLLSAFLYILGAVFYATRVPERIFPGKCDILFQSHQIFHVLVVVATLIDYFGIIQIATVTQFSRNDPSFCPNKQYENENPIHQYL